MTAKGYYVTRLATRKTKPFSAQENRKTNKSKLKDRRVVQKPYKPT
jgi:hypothetical protein